MGQINNFNKKNVEIFLQNPIKISPRKKFQTKLPHSF